MSGHELLAQAKAARLQAQESGESKYVGVACKVCGSTQRYTTGNACALCQKARARAWQVAKPEQRRQYHETWRSNNREYLRAYYKMQKLRAKEQAA